MFVVFVVDTSSTMGQPTQENVSSSNSTSYSGSNCKTNITRIDLAKCLCEQLVKSLDQRIMEHNHAAMALMNVDKQLEADPNFQRCNGAIQPVEADRYLLLSTSPQNEASFSVGAANGLLLVGFPVGTSAEASTDGYKYIPNSSIGGLSPGYSPGHQRNHLSFERELKQLKTNEAAFSLKHNVSGIAGLNSALSFGFQLLSRYRLNSRITENFGMGRNTSSAALQPAILILLTDQECLSQGSLALQFGNMPLRELYREPFRWDQRFFCITIGQNALDSSLRAFCDLTGGCHYTLSDCSELLSITNSLLRSISPLRPKSVPISDPLKPNHPSATYSIMQSSPSPPFYVNGGPICMFQNATDRSKCYRAMILYEKVIGSSKEEQLWCIPEHFFPNKKLDTLPPRSAQPLLSFATDNFSFSSNRCDPFKVMQMITQLNQLYKNTNIVLEASQVKPIHRELQRDVFVCAWLGLQGSPSKCCYTEFMPVYMRGAGRQSLIDGENVLCIGILHVSMSKSSQNELDTLTLLPPDSHILLPLLIRSAETELRFLKKGIESKENRGVSALKNVFLDDKWKAELKAYLYRLPSYYQNSIRRCLRALLPVSIHSMLTIEAKETIASHCFSNACYQKLRIGENMMKEHNDRLERQEEELRRYNVQPNNYDESGQYIGYGQYDSRSSTSSLYLASLRTLPAPWHAGLSKREVDKLYASFSKKDNAIEITGNLPTECLLAYYDSRRRWIFGGSGKTVRDLNVEGVKSDNNVHTYLSRLETNSLLALSGVGCSSYNECDISKMGSYRDRLFYSRSPVIGYGCNDSCGSAATTACDGSSTWSCNDDVLPSTFFNAHGEFIDSVQTRLYARLSINFGNPYKSKRGNNAIPESFISQRRPRKMNGSFDCENDRSTAGVGSPPHSGSPPHDSFTVPAEGEGEAYVALKTHPSNRKPNTQKQKAISDHVLNTTTISHSLLPDSPPPPPPPPKRHSVAKNHSPLSKLHSPSVERRGGLKPPPPPSTAAKTCSAQNTGRTIQPYDLSNPHTKPVIELAPGWITVWSKSQKRWYFFNRNTNKSVWEWPPPL